MISTISLEVKISKSSWIGCDRRCRFLRETLSCINYVASLFCEGEESRDDQQSFVPRSMLSKTSQSSYHYHVNAPLPHPSITHQLHFQKFVIWKSEIISPSDSPHPGSRTDQRIQSCVSLFESSCGCKENVPWPPRTWVRSEYKNVVENDPTFPRHLWNHDLTRPDHRISTGT
jgi:hypothetical protein